ncbi:MAG: ExeM/NucH family extracellular endonuclease, partial [Methylococcales bacterium]|nr:ExeM/NucH family extracellular endonuclease [Methylococcales bacterium]
EIGDFGLGVDDTPGDPNDGCPITGDLTIVKTGPPNALPQIGGLLVYDIDVVNSAATTATNIIVTDTLPVDTTYVGDSSGIAPTNPTSGVYVWTLADLSANLTNSFQVTVSMDVAIVGGTRVTNTVDVSTDLLGDNHDNNYSEWVTTMLAACGDATTLIHAIQGSGTSSGEVGNIHTIEGIVVGDWQATSGELRGFYVQEEDADADMDMTTSEGIFIYDNGFGVDVAEGDLVRVQGTVIEFGGLTEIGTVTEVQVCSSGNSVTETSITLPVTDLADWEQYEGMLVRIEGTLYVTEHYNLGRYGQVPLSVNSRLWNPTQVVTPGVDANNLADLNNRSRITIDDANTSQNPDPVIYPSGELSATNTLRGGDTLPNVVGVLDHYTNDGSEDYRIHPTQAVNFTHANPRPVTPDAVGGSLQVGSFNVLNYFTTIDTGAPICGPNGTSGCRGADSASEFTRQNAKIVNALLTMDADVVGLIEIENHATDAALNFLVSELGVGYAAINTGSIGD